CVGGGEAANAGPVVQRPRERLPDHDPGVLHQVMGVDLDVAGALELEVEAAIAGDLLQHVVQERQAGLDLDLRSVVEAHLALDLGLPASAADQRGAITHRTGVPPPRWRGRSSPPCGPACGPPPAAPAGRPASPRPRWCASKTSTHPAARRIEPSPMWAGCGWVRSRSPPASPPHSRPEKPHP